MAWATQSDARAKLGQHAFDIGDGALHPLELRVGKAFFGEGRAYVVVTKHATVGALGGLVEFDGVVGDSGGLELLGDPLRHITGGLADFELAGVGRIVDGVSVDARPGGWFGRQDGFDGVSHLCHLR